MTHLYKAEIPVYTYDWEKPGWPAEGRSEKEWRLKRNHQKLTTYDAFTVEPNLYLRFLELDPTADNVLAFANRYGELYRFVTRDSGVQEASIALNQWQIEVKRFKRLDAGRQKGNVQTLATQINRLFHHYDVELRIPLIQPYMESVPTPWFGYLTNCVLGAVYLQFIFAITHEVATGACDVCGSLFEIKPKRAYERLTCSDKCRQKRLRQRKNK